MGHGGCGVLVPLLPGVCRRVDHYTFPSLVLGWAFDSSRAYLANCRSAQLYCPSIDGVYLWFPYDFPDGRVPDFVEADNPSQKGIENWALGADRLFAAWGVVWAVSSAN